MLVAYSSGRASLLQNQCLYFIRYFNYRVCDGGMVEGVYSAILNYILQANTIAYDSSLVIKFQNTNQIDFMSN